MKKLLSFIPVTIMIVSGCCFNSTPPKTEYFTIANPSVHARYNYHIQVAPFQANDLYGSKMVFFKEPHSVFFDGFNRWAQTPDKMLTSFFNLYFNNSISPVLKKRYIPIQLNAVILRFECNMTKKECLLCINVSAINTSEKKLLFNEIYLETQQMNKLTASSFASSMFKAVRIVAEKIEKILNNIDEHSHPKKGKE
jgi:ABC-type uncharacterized transport system auxiliary subunit